MRAKALLAGGRPAAALEALRRGRRRRPRTEGPLLALVEADALLALARSREAVAVATRALARRPAEADVAARLHVVRGHGLWLTGPASRARGEVDRAAQQATTPLTRARVLEEQGLFAWKDQRLEEATRRLEVARDLFTRHHATAGVVRVLGKQAGVLRDAGRLPEALALQDERLAAAGRLGRPDVIALARSDRAGLLTAMGRWQEAAEELDAAGALFRDLGDPREFTVAGAGRAVVDLAAGELGRARAALERARELNAERGNTRPLAENLLLTSDLHLASGEAESAERTAVESLDLFRVVQDGEGECRARVRRAHALVGLGRSAEAVREARRAARSAAEARTDLVALALLALGRALLRTDRTQAAAAFERALEVSAGRPAFTHVACLGLAGARAATRESHEVRHALAALEAWGDRRLRAYGLADVREVLGPPAEETVAEKTAAAVSAVPAVSAMAEAAVALLEDGPWTDRWAAAMRACRPAVPWTRAAFVAEPGWELRADLPAARPLAADDLAREIAPGGLPGPRRVELATSAWRDHPLRVLHGLAYAIVAPVTAEGALYVDLRANDRSPDDGMVGLVAALGRLLAARPPDRAVPEPAPVFAGIVGGCPEMQSLFRTLSRVAPSDLVVHVTGETGTGKERVAEALHRHSRRAAGPFVPVNASAIPDELFESQMFGHVRGSFTGAAADHAGYVAEAEGGTLFLDEVADLSPRAQPKLLRFLEKREYRRVGENRVRRADVRIVTAANVPLETRMRPDVVFRLKDLVLTLPPLRDRGDDLWLLAAEFLRQHARPGAPAPALSAEARRRLRAYAWPGNVRELEREIRCAVVLAGRGPVRAEHLSIGAPAGAPPTALRPLKDALVAFERDYVGRALEQLGGNRARTAIALGISRQALFAKIARMGIS